MESKEFIVSEDVNTELTWEFSKDVTPDIEEFFWYAKQDNGWYCHARVQGDFMEDGTPKYKALIGISSKRYDGGYYRSIGKYDNLSDAKSAIEKHIRKKAKNATS